MGDDILDWLTLSALPGIGCGLIRRLLNTFDSPAEIFAAGGAVTRVEGVGRRISAVLTDRAALDRARRWAGEELDRTRRTGVRLLACTDPQFPSLLGTIADAPVLLYLRGDLQILNRPRVAVIGSRAATAYGKRISSMLAAELARQGVVVVSGLAMGIDGQAHAGCLQAGGATIGVLGCGVDVIYPRSHAGLYGEVAARGLLISEYPLGTRPEGFRFPARNRIISGLCSGVVVVEATRRSGSLITARLALDQGREVFAVPGRIDSAKSEGTHRLIQQGAHLVQTAGDILQELELASAIHFPDTAAAAADREETLDARERQLLEHLEVYPENIDELAVKTGLSPGELNDVLLQLELKGMVRQLPGSQYERVS
jgi:DNA processing protein